MVPGSVRITAFLTEQLSVLPALIAWWGWYWWGRDSGIELGEKLQVLSHTGEIFTFGMCLEISLDVRAGCW